MTISQRLTAQVVGVQVLIQLLFGLNFVTSKIIIGVLPPLVWAQVRSIVSALVLIGVALVFKIKPSAPFDRSFFIGAAMLGFLGIALCQGSFLVGLSRTSSINASILATLIPIFTLFIAVLKGAERLSRRRIIGFLIAFLGVLSINRVEDFSITNASLIGDMLVVLSALSLAIFLNLNSSFIQKYGFYWPTVFFFLFGGTELFGLSWAQIPRLQDIDWNNILIASMLFTIFGATLLTYLLTNWSFKHADASDIALFINLQPIFAVFFAWIILDDIISFRAIVSLALIITALYLVITSSDKIKA